MTINLTTVIMGLLTFASTVLAAWLGLRGKQGDQDLSGQKKFYADLVERVNMLEQSVAARDARVNKLVTELAAERGRNNMMAHLLRVHGIEVPEALLLGFETLPEPSEPTEDAP